MAKRQESVSIWLTNDDVLKLVANVTSDDDYHAVVRWAEQAMMSHGFLQNVLDGDVQIVRVTNGTPVFQQTAQGLAHGAKLALTDEGLRLSRRLGANITDEPKRKQ